VGAAMLYSSASIGPAFAPVLRASLGLEGGWAGRLSVVGPGFGAELHAARGSASVRQEFALAELVFAPSRSRFVPFASVGLGAYHFHTQGDAVDPGYVGASNQLWSFLGDAGLGLAARLGTGAALSLELHGLLTAPSGRLVIGDTPIGTVGRPSVVASFGLLS